MPTSDGGLVDQALDGLVTNGVFDLDAGDVVDVDDLRSRAGAIGWAALVADAAGGKGALVDGLAATGAFPDWFGRNWDALDDCLVDLSWLPAEGYLVLVTGWDAFAAGWPGDAATARSVLQHAAREWLSRGTPFVALLGGGSNANSRQ